MENSSGLIALALFLCLASFVLGFGIGRKMDYYLKDLAEPYLEITVKDGISDTTYVYSFE